MISGIKYPNEKLISKLPNVCGYTSKIDFVHLLENARRVFPNRTEVICVSDSSLLGLKGVAELERIWPNFQELHPEYKMKVMNVQSQAPNLSFPLFVMIIMPITALSLPPNGHRSFLSSEKTLKLRFLPDKVWH